jgi:hypothetical protein
MNAVALLLVVLVCMPRLAMSQAIIAPVQFASEINQDVLPLLDEGDISFTNTTDTTIAVEFSPEGCPTVTHTVAPASTVHVKCSGARTVKVVFRTNAVQDAFTRPVRGPVFAKTQQLPASAHYRVGQDVDFSAVVIDIRAR